MLNFLSCFKYSVQVSAKQLFADPPPTVTPVSSGNIIDAFREHTMRSRGVSYPQRIYFCLTGELNYLGEHLIDGAGTIIWCSLAKTNLKEQEGTIRITVASYVATKHHTAKP